MPTLLLVEDKESNAFAFRTFMRNTHKDVAVIHARDGIEAINQLIADDDIRLVIMDIGLPVMDGVDTARRIRAMKGREYIPILALTANTLPKERRRCLSAGMNEFLTKPILGDSLSYAIRTHLN